MKKKTILKLRRIIKEEVKKLNESIVLMKGKNKLGSFYEGEYPYTLHDKPKPSAFFKFYKNQNMSFSTLEDANEQLDYMKKTIKNDDRIDKKDMPEFIKYIDKFKIVKTN